MKSEGKWHLHHLRILKIAHRAWRTVAWELEASKNVNSDGKARKIWKRYAWYVGCYSQTRIQKQTKFIGQCIILSLIFSASSFQFIDFHCWLSHVHLLLGGHFISLLLIFSACLALLPKCVSLVLISIVCCPQSDRLLHNGPRDSG